jgi:hypothetical protein
MRCGAALCWCGGRLPKRGRERNSAAASGPGRELPFTREAEMVTPVAPVALAAAAAAPSAGEGWCEEWSDGARGGGRAPVALRPASRSRRTQAGITMIRVCSAVTRARV